MEEAKQSLDRKRLSSAIQILHKKHKEISKKSPNARIELGNASNDSEIIQNRPSTAPTQGKLGRLLSDKLSSFEMRQFVQRSLAKLEQGHTREMVIAISTETTDESSALLWP